MEYLGGIEKKKKRKINPMVMCICDVVLDNKCFKKKKRGEKKYFLRCDLPMQVIYPVCGFAFVFVFVLLFGGFFIGIHL